MLYHIMNEPYSGGNIRNIISSSHKHLMLAKYNPFYSLPAAGEFLVEACTFGLMASIAIVTFIPACIADIIIFVLVDAISFELRDRDLYPGYLSESVFELYNNIAKSLSPRSEINFALIKSKLEGLSANDSKVFQPIEVARYFHDYLYADSSFGEVEAMDKLVRHEYLNMSDALVSDVVTIDQ